MGPTERLRDDLGRAVEVPRPVRRVVSLVPSLTEAVAESAPELLAGRTVWCTEPAGLAAPTVRGTKNPDVQRIAALKPDLVVANQEENRKRHVDWLAERGIAVWVTAVHTVPAGIAALRRLLAEVLQLAEPEWLHRAADAWAGPPPPAELRVAVPVWRDPWMVLGPDTFASDLLRRAGAANVFAEGGEGAGRYPRTGPAGIAARRPDVVLLPDEPYPFAAADGPEALAPLPCALLPGRDLTWYGPSLAGARDRVRAALLPGSASGAGAPPLPT
ncbi:helical backbone metal receptor [Nocardiopsis coralliicola]